MSLTSIGNNAAASTVLIEGLDAQQRVIWRERVVLDAGKSSFTIGRSLSADLVLSDDHSAPLHASVAVQPDGALVATDLGSKNGIVTGKIRHQAARDVPLAGNQLQIGRTLLRIRSSREALAPEILDKKLSPSRLHSPVLLAAIGAGVLAVQLIYNQWLGAPRDLATGIVTTLAGTGFVVAAWSGIWALLSRILVSEWRWPAHAAIVLCLAAVYTAFDSALGLFQFMFTLPNWSQQTAVLAALFGGSALYLHLSQASALTTRRAALVAAGLPAVVCVGALWLQSLSSLTNVNQIDSNMRIYPAGLRVTKAGSVDSFFKDAANLQATADKRRAALQKAEPDDGE